MRIPSARSSVAYDDYPSHLHPHALRSVSSRFSLGDFAATRSEFDFDDDASSIFERATLASDAGDVASDKFVAVGGLGLGPVGESGQTVNGDEDDDGEGGSSGDYYDLLCLPQDPSLTPHRIRQAYWRLLALLLNNDCPENLIPLATTYLVEAQQAFETLIDPARRVDYDDRLRTWLVRDDEFQTEDRKELYEDALADHLWLASQRQAFSSSAVNIRLDTCSVAPDSYQVVSRNVLLRPLDFALSHSVTTTLSSLGRSLKRLLVDERLVPHMRVTGALTELTATSDIYLPAPELTISGSAYATGSVRYSRDVSSLDIMPSSTDSRLEVELASTLFFKRHLAVRNLWRVGVHAKLGLEIGISSHTFHLSLYWSRLKHRFSLPLLLSSPGTSASANVVFWAGVLPFLAMAGMQYLSATSLATKTKSSDMKTTEEIECRVARKCAEADNVAAFLAAPVEAKQQRQREKDGLVILDAKYGVKSMLADGTGSLWNAGQVADVTVATAALVDDHGRLVIPSGVKKSGVLGFWDPAPGSIKVLQVRYMYGGKEEMIDVKGRRALVLPPMKDDV
ncbi:hypothetical protein ACHAQH_000146 [Verticillium albo-atrum]